MTVPHHLRKPELSDYLHGFALAVILTVVPFSLVAFGGISKSETLIIVAALAVIQMAVHLHFFLHYSRHRTPIEARIALALAIFVGMMLVGGCMWIMTDLHYRMMP